ncbi:MAG: type 1 glutamine amidotransferase, partial [Pseudomonadota bacterium]
FGREFAQIDPSLELVPFEVVNGVLPASPHDCDAWLVTGSKFGVYDPEPWIEPLKAFLRQTRDARVPMIGVCFGHQIMAEAFGGSAAKSDKGWGCGVHDYAIHQKPSWLKMDRDSFAMHAMHQDQVLALPDDAEVLASSPFCENAMVAYGDPEAPYAISIQPHPEFTRGYAQAVVEFRKTVLIPDPVADVALDSFGRPVDGLAFLKCALDYARAQTSADKKLAS